MNIFITGATGLLGSHIVERLAAHDGISITAHSTNREKALRQFFNANMKIVIGEEIDKLKLDAFDIILNCAYPMNKKGKELTEGLSFIETLMKRAAAAPVKGFINISSQSVYGNTRDAVATEDDICAPEDIYALGKLMIERLSDVYLEGIPHLNIRLASLLAPELKARFVNKFIEDIIAGKGISVAGGSQRIQFMDIKDATDAISLICTDWDYRYSGPLNVGGTTAFSLKEYAEMANRVAVSKGISATPVTYNELISNKNTMMDSGKMMEIFGWKPHCSIEDTISNIFDAMPDFFVCGGGVKPKRFLRHVANHFERWMAA